MYGGGPVLNLESTTGAALGGRAGQRKRATAGENRQHGCTEDNIVHGRLVTDTPTYRCVGGPDPPWLLSPVVSSTSDGPTFARCWWRVKLGLPTLNPRKNECKAGVKDVKQVKTMCKKYMLRMQPIYFAYMRTG
ncbi:predicted protein [Pyrenophora tritici-repentis Pt-1C-BFP]|uniref:Uncharacterized protein n=1 Tax=Pyrenophora tritici-repentis (strain Pt-1C-BFP) TaxID=426418 RepID=B2W005_PYRTR|nr:uncharacterized protein PTRG_02995 [Pyrenophora tritici-repentis Pt-1C-BFP]EDU45518.1 predicted protein [Pyrenophora tritici-repentis Pt-1C-BFP]